MEIVIFGYIETYLPEETDCCLNREALAQHSYDEDFPAIFHDPVRGYRRAIISFGGAFKGNPYKSESWDYWQARFEALLGDLRVDSATVQVDGEVSREPHRTEYWCRERFGWTLMRSQQTEELPGWPRDAEWLRWTAWEKGQDPVEETIRLASQLTGDLEGSG